MKLYQGWHSGRKFLRVSAIVAVQCSAEGVPAPHKISLDGLHFLLLHVRKQSA